MTDNYELPVAQLLTYGDPRGAKWPDYTSLGLTEADIPALIRMATDPTLTKMDETAEEPPVQLWGPIHAWRALGQLRAGAAVEPLISLWETASQDEGMDDWLFDDLPEAIGMIGAPAIGPLSAHLHNAERLVDSRVAAAIAMRQAAGNYPELRNNVVKELTAELEKYDENDTYLSTTLVGELVDLEAAESAAVIKAAFYAERVDPTYSGAWGDVREELGLDPSAEVPGPEPALLELRSLFQGLDSTPGGGGAARPRPNKASKKAKAKRKQEKKSRKQNRKRK